MDDDEDDNNNDVEDEIFGRPAKVTAQFQWNSCLVCVTMF